MMTTQKKKPLPGQHRKVEPLTRKAEAAAPPRPQLEVLQERMDHLATREQVNKLHGEAMGRIDQMATKEQMNKLHGEAMGRIDQMATKEQMNKLHGEAMRRIDQMATKEQLDATKEQMHKLHGEAMGRIDVLQERMNHTATKAEMHQLHGETMGRMNELHLAAMERIGRGESRMSKMESDLATIKWIGGVLTAAVITGFVKLIFFP